MKRLTVFGLALLLITGTTAALAGGRGNGGGDGHHNGYGGDGHHNKHYYKQRYKHHYKHHYKHRYKHRVQHYNRFRPGRHFYSRSYYRPSYYYYPNYLGAALIGSALTSSLYHTHNGARCYDEHSDDRYRQSSSHREIVGCHRIQVLADGSERRIEVPISQCN